MMVPNRQIIIKVCLGFHHHSVHVNREGVASVSRVGIT
jgi:hypothetical protein